MEETFEVKSDFIQIYKILAERNANCVRKNLGIMSFLHGRANSI